MALKWDFRVPLEPVSGSLQATSVLVQYHFSTCKGSEACLKLTSAWFLAQLLNLPGASLTYIPT